MLKDKKELSDNPILSEIKNKGYFPSNNIPIGWDNNDFKTIFPAENILDNIGIEVKLN